MIKFRQLSSLIKEQEEMHKSDCKLKKKIVHFKGDIESETFQNNTKSIIFLYKYILNIQAIKLNEFQHKFILCK